MIKTIFKRCFLWLIIAIIFTIIQINQSLRQGQLSLPPSYDDVSYFNDALMRLDIFYNDGFGGLVSNYTNHTPHSPISALLAFVGFSVFGIKDWAPAFMNFSIIAIVLIFLDYLSRGLKMRWKVLITLTSLTWLLMGHAVIEFRPDIFCGLMTAMAIILISEKSWLSATSIRKKVIGIVFGLALLIKPTIFPVTIILVVSAIATNILVEKFLLKEKIFLKEVFIKSKEFILYSVLVSSFYYLFGLKDAINYIYQNQFVDLEKVWGMHALPFIDRVSYYLLGQGGSMMVGDWIHLWIFLVVISGGTVLLKKKWKEQIYLPSLVITGLLAFSIVVISNHKSPFLGVIVACLIFFTSMQMLIFIIKNIQPFKRSTQKYLNVAILLFFVFTVYLFEWPAPNDLAAPEFRTPPERKYHANLLVNIYNDIENDIDYFNARNNLRKYSKEVYLSSMSHWLQYDSLIYYQMKSGVNNLSIKNGALSDDKVEKIKKINKSDYVIAFSTPSLDTPDWLPSVRIEKDVVNYLDSSSNFKMIHEYINPYTKAKVFLYAKIYPIK